MNHEIERRLNELRRELEGARQMLSDIDSQRVGIRSQMLRISGAIQVLEELHAGANTTAA